MAWSIDLDPRAKRELNGLDPQIARRISRFLFERLAHHENPRSIGEALKGSDLGDLWKYRVGDYASSPALKTSSSGYWSSVSATARSLSFTLSHFQWTEVATVGNTVFAEHSHDPNRFSPHSSQLRRRGRRLPHGRGRLSRRRAHFRYARSVDQAMEPGDFRRTPGCFYRRASDLFLPVFGGWAGWASRISGSPRPMKTP